MSKIILLAIFLVFSFTVQAKFNQFRPLDNSSAAFTAKANQALQEVSNRLPPLWLERLPREVGLTIKKNSKPGAIDQVCAENGKYELDHSDMTFGYAAVVATADYSGPMIAIDESLFQESSIGCTSEQLHLLLQKTIVHELSHIYDLFIPDPQPSYDHEALCNVTAAWQPIFCFQKNRISDELRFILLAGFRPSLTEKLSDPNDPSSLKFDVVSVQRMNSYFERSPRSYESTNLQEYFAVNMEYFLFDPEYKCRRPALNDYLKEHFSFDPFPEVSCTQQLKVVTLQGRVFSIDPNKVYEIHYVITSPGSQLQSLWGHSLLRIVMCSPERVNLSADCLKDTKYHIVVDFAAQLFDEKLSLWGALTGRYNNGLTFRVFSDLQKESQIASDRSFTSYPLRLNKSEQENLIKTLVEKGWQEASPYYFLGSNCSTQILTTVISAVTQKTVLNHRASYELWLPQNIMTPAKLTHYLMLVGLIDKNLFTPTEGRYYFSNFTESIQDANAKYKLILQELGISSFQSFLSESSNESRRLSYGKILSVASTQKISLLDLKKILVTIEATKKEQVMQKIIDFWMNKKRSLSGKNSSSEKSADGSFAFTNRLWDGYGIPQKIEDVSALIGKIYEKEQKEATDYLLGSLTPVERESMNRLYRLNKAIEENQKMIIFFDVSKTQL